MVFRFMPENPRLGKTFLKSKQLTHIFIIICSFHIFHNKSFILRERNT